MRLLRSLVPSAVAAAVLSTAGCHRVRGADGTFRVGPVATVVPAPSTPPAAAPAATAPTAPRPTAWRARYFQISDG